MTITDQNSSARDALLQSAREELIERGHASVSLRAVARRAGLSHAAPAHFFGDRAGMLTAVATVGFDELGRTLAAATRDASASGQSALDCLGLAYVEFGLAQPALMDLMFRRSELVTDDPAFVAAQRTALGYLRDAVSAMGPADSEEWSLVSWAVVHGLVSLTREGALTRVAETHATDPAGLARHLVAVYGAGVTAISAQHT
ncbi:TetR/AcrR family transcriptional regulator [Microbacterium insulae]|uniref:TetR/AcrR family transcriptional regulator n=1 Tax=Microbacterium insulae TaxID=483014 RepID=A0ABW3AI53_9MICO